MMLGRIQEHTHTDTHTHEHTVQTYASHIFSCQNGHPDKMSSYSGVNLSGLTTDKIM